MIEPTIEGLHIGQKVRIEAPDNADHGKEGYIVSIEQAPGMFVFWVDFGEGEHRSFVASQLRAV